MQKLIMATAGLALCATTATAGGLDRTFTPIDLIFEDGNHLEFSVSKTMPTLSGADLLGAPIPNVADDYTNAGAGIRIQMTDSLALGIILDQPYGGDVTYSPLTPLLGNTFAKASSKAATFLLHYQINDNFSVYGGPRWVKAQGDIGISGLAYGPASGSVFTFSSDTGIGYVVGAAYERPELGQRISFTYHSKVDLNFGTVERLPPLFAPLPTGTTDSETPQSFELAGQTGINPRTLIFGSVRWSEWSAFTLIPPAFGRNLASLQDQWTIELGVGRKFSDKFSGSFAVTHDLENNTLVSPLSPNNGSWAVSVGGKYNVTDKVSLSGGVRYTMLGDALPQTAGAPRASFSGNDAISVGFKVGIDLD